MPVTSLDIPWCPRKGDREVRRVLRRALRDAWPAACRFGWELLRLCELHVLDEHVGSLAASRSNVWSFSYTVSWFSIRSCLMSVNLRNNERLRLWGINQWAPGCWDADEVKWHEINDMKERKHEWMNRWINKPQSKNLHINDLINQGSNNSKTLNQRISRSMDEMNGLGEVN